jgi:hypothetical protein
MLADQRLAVQQPVLAEQRLAGQPREPEQRLPSAAR